MLSLAQLRPKQKLRGLIPDDITEIVAVSHSDDEEFYSVVYRASNGSLGERTLYPDAEESLVLVNDKAVAFTGNSNQFRLYVEAKRIEAAYCFDPMMAVHSSSVMPLPHQITAVYEEMLPRLPLRFLLADDPGAGKTIMAGLLISELYLRAESQRVLIVAPGSLVEQWQNEMRDKFGLYFEIFSQDKNEKSPSGNPLKNEGFWIARVDQLSRREDMQAQVKEIPWDLIVVDEAHKMSAHFSGQDVKKTKRFRLGELLSKNTRNFLLMTATPHNGKEEEFQLFLSLLDADRFYGKSDRVLQRDDLKDIMRRMVKEKMKKFDGSNLFPERLAKTAEFELSKPEAQLYDAVTDYVRNEMNRADRIADQKKKNVVGFSLTLLQRRLASSPEAIYQSLKRRHKKLSDALSDIQQGKKKEIFESTNIIDLDFSDDFDIDDLPGEDQEEVEDEVTSQATAARTEKELLAETTILKDLEEQAYRVLQSNTDSKWTKLSELIQEGTFSDRKLIVFTEHKDTLNYLKRKIGNLVGKPESIRVIHGGVSREERLKIQEEFRNDREVRYLIATDAAGEGVNLQNTNMMINYDLPWNPNRIEQRFGRIHRIGQKEVCYLWNMVAGNTREGEVFKRLFEKLEVQKQTLGGQVFDVLGEVFHEYSLKDILLKSIREGNKKQQLALKEIDKTLDVNKFREIINKNAVWEEILNDSEILDIKRKMEEAEARKLQPYYVRSFFRQAIEVLNGSLRSRDFNRYEVKRVPPEVLEYKPVDRNGNKLRLPILQKYERVCFDQNDIYVEEDENCKYAEFLHPGHPLVQSLNHNIQKRFKNIFSEGTVFIDPNDKENTEPRILVVSEIAIREEVEPHNVVNRKIEFLYLDSNGNVTPAGFAPHLDLSNPNEEELRKVSFLIKKNSDVNKLKGTVLSFLQRESKKLLDKEAEKRKKRLDHVQNLVSIRLNVALNYLDDKRSKLKDRNQKGRAKNYEANMARYDNYIRDLKDRRDRRINELRSQEKLFQETPKILSYALVIPQRLVDNLKGNPVSQATVESRKRIERIAMQAVMESERSIGFEPIDCSKENKGWDIESRPKSGDGDIRFIEVKGRVKGEEKIHVTHNEVLQGFNLKKKFFIAFVRVDGESNEEPLYIQEPFTQQPDWADAGKDLEVAKLLTRAKKVGETR